LDFYVSRYWIGRRYKNTVWLKRKLRIITSLNFLDNQTISPPLLLFYLESDEGFGVLAGSLFLAGFLLF
jgi:hypothetical protein